MHSCWVLLHFEAVNASWLVTTTFVVETFPPLPLANVGSEKIQLHEETSTLRGEQGVSTILDEGCSCSCSSVFLIPSIETIFLASISIKLKIMFVKNKIIHDHKQECMPSFV